MFTSRIVEEAQLERVGSGLAPVSDGWFVVNARDAAWIRHDTFGLRCTFETGGPVARSRAGLAPAVWRQLGFQLSVLAPGQPSTLYHEEPGNEENFLVLAGECTAFVERETRRLKQWDFVHCPPGTKHSFRGAGESECVLLCVGARVTNQVRYHPTPLTESVERVVESGAEAYAPYGHWVNDGESPL